MVIVLVSKWFKWQTPRKHCVSPPKYSKSPANKSQLVFEDRGRRRLVVFPVRVPVGRHVLPKVHPFVVGQARSISMTLPMSRWVALDTDAGVYTNSLLGAEAPVL